MTIRLRLLAALAVLCLLTSPVSAKEFTVKIAAARVGFPLSEKSQDKGDAGQSSHITKFAAWAPIYIDLEVLAEVSEPLEIVVESADPDEISTTLAVPLNLFPLNLSGAKVGTRISASDLGAIGYIRPAGIGEATITIRGTTSGTDRSEPFRIRALRPKDRLTYLVLTLGPHIPDFELPKPTVGVAEQSAGFRGGRVELTEIADVNQLPDRWFGYESVDLIVLNTAPGSNAFLEKLFGEKIGAIDNLKRDALVEWIRRGGRLVVTVGGNAGLVSQLPALLELLPYEINRLRPSRQTDVLALSWGARETSQTSTLSGALGSRSGTFPVTNLQSKLERSAHLLIPTRDRLKDPKEVVAGQAPYGIGRVTVVGFDLDRPPFTEFTQRAEFWDWILRDGGANRASAGSEGKPKPGATGPTEEEDEVATALRMHLDTFENVPVVSFGWVAMLLGLYILLIGPVEYFFLKRILGRMELTWITFPIIVLTVSLAACFMAYSIKGRELKINKLDAIDIDLTSNRVYATTWFTIFSPRIETYTLGVTPGEEWSAESEPGTVVDWVGAPRGGRPALMHRGYRYHAEEDGLENVPIQVWSTKSFVANWSGRISPGVIWKGQPGDTRATQLVESRLEHPPGDPSTVIGTFVNRLPIPILSDCVAFYAGQAYPIPGGTIQSGETIRLVLDKGILASQWLQKDSRLEDVLRRVPSYAERPSAGKIAAVQPVPAGSQAVFDGSFPFWGVFFHESSLTFGEGVIPRNASLRWLDQSWRLDPANRNQVILVGRATPPVGPAEETLSGPASPSRLWLKAIPGTEKKEGKALNTRTPIPGTGQQETWVRMYLPVR